MAMTHSTIIGVFDEAAAAQRAIEALQQAGVSSDQIRYSGSIPSESVLERIKSMFTRHDAAASTLINELMALGVAEEKAKDVARDYQAGHPIVAVGTGGGVQEILDILQSQPGYRYGIAFPSI
jgi:hypothetical protein